MKFRYLVILLLSLFSVSLPAQDTLRNKGLLSEHEMDSLIDQVNKFLDELVDLEMFDDALKVRQASKSKTIKDIYKAHYQSKDTSSTGLPIDILLYSHLDLDHFWARALTGKYIYTPEGKQKGELHTGEMGEEVNGIFSTRLNYIVDSLPNGRWTVGVDLKVGSVLRNFNESNEDFLELDKLRSHIKGMFEDDYASPGDMPFNRVTKFVFEQLSKRAEKVKEVLMTRLDELKDLYAERDIKNAAKALDEQIKLGKQASYVIDKEGRLFKEEHRTHFHEQLKELNAVSGAPVYVLNVTTSYLFNEVELRNLAHRITSESKLAESNKLSLLVVNTFANDSIPGVELYSSSVKTGKFQELFALFKKNNEKVPDEVFYSLQEVLYGMMSQLPSEKLPTTQLASMFNSMDMMDVDEARRQGYQTTSIHKGLQGEITVGQDVECHYTPSGFAVKPAFGKEFEIDYGHDFTIKRMDGLTALFSASKWEETVDEKGMVMPGFRMWGYVSESLKNSIRQKRNNRTFLLLSEIKGSYFTPEHMALEGSTFEYCEVGEKVERLYLVPDECMMEVAEHNLGEGYDSEEGEEVKKVPLCGSIKMPTRPENREALRYEVSYSIGMEEYEPLLCRISEIYKKNGYGKLFLERFLPKVKNDEDKKWLVEIALLYDRTDGELMDELSDEVLEIKKDFLWFWEKTNYVSNSLFLEVMLGERSYEDFYYKLSSQYSKFKKYIRELKGAEDEDRIAHLVNHYLTEYQMINYLNYKERIRLINLLADHNKGSREEAIIKLLHSFPAANKKEEIRNFLQLLTHQPDRSDESLLMKLDDGFADWLNDDSYHAFISIITLYSMEVYLEEKKAEIEQRVNSEDAFSTIRFYQADEVDWGYQVHKYRANWKHESGQSKLALEYNYEFQFTKGFTGEMLNHGISMATGLFSGGTTLLAQNFKGKGLRTVANPLSDFYMVYDPKGLGQSKVAAMAPVFPAYYIRYLSQLNDTDRATFYGKLALHAAAIGISVATLGAASPLMVVIESIGLAVTIYDLTLDVMADIEKIDKKMAENLQEVSMYIELATMVVGGADMLANSKFLKKVGEVFEMSPAALRQLGAAESARLEELLANIRRVVGDFDMLATLTTASQRLNHMFAAGFDAAKGSLKVAAEETHRLVKSIPASAKNLMEVDISEAVINGVHYLRGKSKVKVFEDGGHLKCCIDDGFCFVAGTPIWTKNDTFKPIEEVREGDEVWSFDHQNNHPVSNKVTRTFIRTKDQLLKILIGATMLMVTPEHPLFANGAYTKASDLRVGDEVSNYDDRASLVKSIEAIDTLVTVYNFEVEKAHNYFVGEDRLLVHNTCGWETIMEKLDAEAFRTFSNEVINAGLLPYQRRNVYEAIKKLPRESLTAITSELGKNHDFLKAVASQPEYVKAWSVFAEAEDVLTRAYRQSEEHLEAVASYLRSHPDADLAKLYDDYKLARDKDEWFKRMAKLGEVQLEVLNTAINIGKRSDGTLAKALDDANFTECAKAVRNSGKVSRNNKLGLDKGDNGLPDAELIYVFKKNGKTYSKQTGENWSSYFKRLKTEGFNVFESHHIFPIDLFKRESFRKWYELVGYKYFDVNGENDLMNLIMLEKKVINNGGVHSRHDAYTSKIGEYFDQKWKEILSLNPRLGESEVAEILDGYIKTFVLKLKQSLVENSVKSNVEISKYWESVDISELIN